MGNSQGDQQQRQEKERQEKERQQKERQQKKKKQRELRQKEYQIHSEMHRRKREIMKARQLRMQMGELQWPGYMRYQEQQLIREYQRRQMGRWQTRRLWFIEQETRFQMQKELEKAREQMRARDEFIQSLLRQKEIEQKIINQQRNTSNDLKVPPPNDSPNEQPIERTTKVQNEQLKQTKQNEKGAKQIQDKPHTATTDKTLQSAARKEIFESSNIEMKNYQSTQTQSNLQKCESQSSDIVISCQTLYQNQLQQSKQKQVINPEISQQLQKNNQRNIDKKNSRPFQQKKEKIKQIKQNFKSQVRSDVQQSLKNVVNNLIMALQQRNIQRRQNYIKQNWKQIFRLLASLPLRYGDNLMAIMAIKHESLAGSIGYLRDFGIPALRNILQKLINKQGRITFDDIKDIVIDLAKSSLNKYLCTVVLSAIGATGCGYFCMCIGIQILLDILFDVFYYDNQGTLKQRLIRSVQNNKQKWIGSFISFIGYLWRQGIISSAFDWVKKKCSSACESVKNFTINVVGKIGSWISGWF